MNAKLCDCLCLYVFVCLCDALSCSDVMHLPGGFVLVQLFATCASDAGAVFVLNKHKYTFMSLFVFRLVLVWAKCTWLFRRDASVSAEQSG